MKLKDLQKIVEEVLIEKPQSRRDDFMLIGSVWKRQGLDLATSIGKCLMEHKTLKLSSPESITRCRRKIQSEQKYLIDEDMEECRKEETKKFINYNRS